MHQEKEKDAPKPVTEHAAAVPAAPVVDVNKEAKVDPATPKEVPAHADDPKTKEEQEKEDYLVKQLHRIP
jgi:hypothetical protein